MLCNHYCPNAGAPSDEAGCLAAPQELCAALEGTPHYVHLDAAACAAARQPPRSSSSSSSSSSGGEAPAENGGSGSRGSGTNTSASAAGQPLPQGLLQDWCLPQDKEASGWAALSDVECSRRAEAVQAAAAAAVRAGNGTQLFKHVHKASMLLHL